ncbi:cardiolipin synthase [Candidatus Formimonas warabiya]|uniref:Cardiolipin synthase n=2 Tax=Formimonas warabiya TaxID=1761012 RepID=A0A3G1L2G4_FORW1|nr:cardiolipin synthase [Candidatus Formimonas warabiya]
MMVTNLILAVVLVLFERRNPMTILVWLMVISFFPIFGFLLYLFLGQDLRKRKLFILKGKEEDKLIRTIRYQRTLLYGNQYKFKDPRIQQYTDMITLQLASSDAPLSEDNDVKIFAQGEEKFAELLKCIKNAKKFIHIEYYIIRNDSLGRQTVELLAEKAREGVEVKFLIDGMGGIRLPRHFFDPLTQAGGKIAVFYPPFLPYINLRVNYRNHRKICVFDGETGFVGGFNIGTEYLGLSKRFGFWRDIHLKIGGSAVNDLESRFMLDWRFASGEEMPFDDVYFPQQSCRGNTAIQIVSSGPDSKWRPIRNGYLKIIHGARDHVFIETPYFIPDAEILCALKIAALSGVDIRVIIPEKQDHLFVHWAAMSYIGELLEAGVRFFAYQKGFIHSKMITADGFVSSVGTANLDIRSFRVNFEVNAFIYNGDTAQELDELFINDMYDSREITLEYYNQRPLRAKTKDAICRLLSPLL